LRQWLSPVQRAQFAEKGYFEVVGGDTGKRYRIYAGAATNVCKVDENGHLTLGLCFLPMGELPIGDVMLSQKIALESSESRALAVARSSFRMAGSGDVRFFAKASRNQSAIGRSGENAAEVFDTGLR
jgi:hypothetical protein